MKSDFSRASSSRHRYGFTLVELLVTITILVALAGLSVAGYSSVMQRVRMSKTIDNMKRLAVGTLLYDQDHSGIIWINHTSSRCMYASSYDRPLSNEGTRAYHRFGKDKVAMVFWDGSSKLVTKIPVSDTAMRFSEAAPPVGGSAFTSARHEGTARCQRGIVATVDS